MTKVVITGGAGFIGSHLVELSLQKKYQVVVIDNFKTGKRENISAFLENDSFTLVKADICDKHNMDEAFKDADYVLHLAARISVPESMDKPTAYFSTNTIGTLNVVQCAQQHNVKGMVHSSSAAVYGDNPELPKIETMRPEPQSPYAISKLDGEYLLSMAALNSKLKTTSLRYFNVFGPRQDPLSAYAAAVPIFIHHAVRNQDITIFGDGKQTRDFIYVEDIAKANLAACKKGGDVINAACGRSITINELAKQIIDITGSSSKILHQPDRAGDIKHSCADNSRYVEQLELQPQADLRKGLEKTIDYFDSIRVSRGD
ncbi:MAG: NAD-dependent epimerase/dehydratase family protein [Coxiellaceae bacterium]|nr:NAD-dependent epimerase/dehydratase family protein [Coxiellaceae bacterium]